MNFANYTQVDLLPINPKSGQIRPNQTKSSQFIPPAAGYPERILDHPGFRPARFSFRSIPRIG